VKLGNHLYETFGNIRAMQISETIFGIDQPYRKKWSNELFQKAVDSKLGRFELCWKTT